MTSLVSLFNYAEASLAAYADLNDGKKTLDQKEALKEAGMTEDQAIQFASRWPDVIEQYTDAISGFSATLFRNGNEVCLAIAGTDSLLDVAIDIGLAEGLGAQAQYNALQGFYGSLISTGKIQSTDSVTVSGHSLGGFLAQIFAVDHAGEIAQTYTYNAPGIGGSVAQILDLMGVAATNIDTSNILNVQGDGFSVTAGLGTLLGSVQQVQIENNAIWIPGDHTIKKLTDSLAVYDTLWQLDPSFTLEQYAEIFKASSNDESLSLEGAVSKLCAMFGVAADSALTSSNENMQREALFSTVYRLRDTESYNALINNATVSSSLSINAQQAATDFGAFLALHTLSPIYISGAALQEVNGSLYDQWSAGHFSAQYLEDRVAMLGALLGANMADIDYDDVRGVYFSDAETGVVVGESDGGIFSADNKQTLFGSEASDTLTSGNANDHLYGGGGSDFLASGAGDDYLEGGAGDDGLNAGTGFDRVNGGMGNDAYLIDSNFGDVMIADDLDGGSISLLSGITFRRVGDGEANANGLYIAVDENGEWLNGKDGWSVSVSGSTATVSIMDNQNNVHVIAIEDFNITSNKFGIQFDEMADVEMPSLGGAFTVPNRGLLGAYTPQGAEKPVEVFLPNNRHVENKDPSIPEALNVEQYRNKSLIYNAVDYWGEWNASDLRWESIEDYPGTPHPDHPDEVLVIYTRESSHGIKVMRFEGSNQNDALYGNDWTSQMRAIEAWDQTNYHHYRLNEINDFDPEIHGNNDVLFGLNGDDLIIGDGDQSVLTQPVGSQKGNRDILVGGRGSDVIYGMGGNDILLGMEQYRSSWGAASLGLTYNPSKYASLAEAIFNNAFLYDPETQQETQTAITLEDKDERNYLNGGDGDDVLEGASFSDVLDGGHGKDWIYAGAGRDVVAGGAGDDEISGDSYAYFYQGIAYSDFIAPDELPEANDYRRGHFYQKTSEGVALRYDFNKNTDYNDVLDGGEGNDLVQGEIGADIVSGGAGNDVLFGDRVFGAGFFVDGLPPANFQSLAQQFHGNDVVDGGDGDDLVVGGGGADRVLGGNGNDTIYGDVGLDTIEKGMNTTGAPSIASSDEGWWGNDVLLGGAGNDVLVGEGGDDVVDGGEGDDYLYGDWANWQAQAYADPEARTGNDTLYGGAGNDQLMGNGGDDVLDGGAGDDFLYAGIGDDTLIGGSGNDYLDGGEGDDVYSIAAGDGQDVITDTEGSNILRVATGSVEVETAGNDAATVYLSADRSQFVTLTQGSLNTFSVQTANGDAVTQRQHIEVSTRYGSPLVYTVNSSMTGDVDVNGAEAGVALQLTSARQAFTAPAAVTVDESGAHILLTRADGKALTVHLDSWDQLTALTDKYGFQLDFSLDASAESNGVLNGRSGNDALTGNEGDETLYGYNGNDTLTGAGGNDNLIGGAGDDRYVFTSGDNGADTVLDHEGSNTLQLNHLSGNSASVDVLVGTQSVQVLTSKDGSSYATMDNATWQAIASCETADGVAVSEYRYRIAAGASVTLTPHFDGAQFVILLPAGSTLADFSGGHSLSHPQDLVLQAADGTFIRVEGYFASNGFSNNSAWSIGSDAESSQSLASWVDTHMSSDYSIDGFLTEQTAVLQPMGEAGKTLGDTQNIVVGEQYTVEGEAYGARIKSYTFDGVSAESIVLDGSPLVVASSEQNTMDLSEQTHWVLTEVPVYRDYYTNGGTYTLSGDDPALGSMRVNGNVSLQENDDGTVTATVSGNYSSSQVGTEARWTSYTETVADVTRRYTQYQITGDERDDTVTASGSFLGTIDVGDGDNTVDLGGDHQTLWSFWKPRGGLDVPGAYLTAGSGDDHLIGTRGNDVLRANAGANTVVGGAGNDVYYVSLASGSQTTVIDAAVEGVYDWHDLEAGNPIRLDGNDWSGYYIPVNNTLVFTDAFDLSTVTYSIERFSVEEESNGLHFDATRPYTGSGNADWSTSINTRVTLHIGDADVSVLVGEDWLRDGDGDDMLRIAAGVQTVVLADGSALTWDALLRQATQVESAPTQDQIANQIITTTYNTNDSQFVALNAGDILDGTVSDAEKSRWQIVSASQISGNFLPDQFDVNGDGDISDQTFLFIENLWNSGVNYVGFMPNTIAGNASFAFTLQRDDGLRIESTMQVITQENTSELYGSNENDILDGGQITTPLLIDAGEGNDRVFDGYGDDVVYGGDGNDALMFGNWADNGNDIFIGGAGDDVLDAGWGTDTMIGGTGNDLYIETNLWSGDRTTIDNTGGNESDTDILQIGENSYGMWDYRSLWFTRDGSDLLVDQLDELADGEIRIKNWYADTDTNEDGLLNDAGDGRIDLFVAKQEDGAVFQAEGNSNSFDALINAMAQFGAKPASVTEAGNALQDEYQAAWMQIAVPTAA